MATYDHAVTSAYRVKKGYKNFGNNVKKSFNNAKRKTKEYAGKVSTAYNVGYSSGVKDYPDIPKTFGAQKSATMGYSKGLRDTHKNQKYLNKVNKTRRS